MAPGQDRKRMEDRYGEVGSGVLELTIRGKTYHLDQLLKALGLDHADIRPIDAHRLDGPERFAIRCLDIEERVVVAYEFDAAFEYLGEQAAHVDEWLGDEYYTLPGAASGPRSP